MPASDHPSSLPRPGGTRPWRSLRFRITAGYVLGFAIALSALGVLFLAEARFRLQQLHGAVLAAERDVIVSSITVTPQGIVWANSVHDPDRAYHLARLRRLLLITTLDGRILEISDGYRRLSADDQPDALLREIESTRRSPQPVVTVRQADSRPHLIWQTTFRQNGGEYFLSMAADFSDAEALLDTYRRTWLLSMPVVMLVSGLFGWWISRRALRPLNDVLAAAERVSVGSLSLRVPSPHSGDELDALIMRFNSMVERLERSFAQIAQFSVDASHELRTPLTAIRGQLEVALMTGRTEADYRDAIADALEGVDRISQIVKSLLTLAQAESGQLVLHKSVVDVAATLGDIVNQFRLSSDEKRITIRTTIESPCWAELDRVQFERLVMNLLSNAVRFTPEGGEIRIVLFRSQTDLHLTVSDSGPGVSPEHLPHIFERFYRAVHSEHEGEKGLGLGLSFVDWIVKAHGGRITVESEPGKGASFLVTLPGAREGGPAGPPLEARRQYETA